MLNRLFGNVFGDVFTCLAPVRRDEFDQQDVTETENQFRIKLRFNSDITKKDITLRVDGNILYIEELNKCGVSCCKREIPIPDYVKKESFKATFVNGCLEIVAESAPHPVKPTINIIPIE